MKKADVEKARKLRERGWTYSRIGHELGVNWQTVRYNLRPDVREERRKYLKEYEKRPDRRGRRRLTAVDLAPVVKGPVTVGDAARKLGKFNFIVRYVAERSPLFTLKGDVISPVSGRKGVGGKLRGWLGRG